MAGDARDQARAQARAAAVAVSSAVPDRLDRVRLRDDGDRPRGHGHAPGATYRGCSTPRSRRRSARGDAHVRDPDRVHGPGRGCRVPDAALQHRGRGPALPRCDRGGRDRALPRRPGTSTRRRSTSRPWSSQPRCSGARWAAIPGVLRAFAHTNEIITSLMLNYVAGLLLTYLIIDSPRTGATPRVVRGPTFPHGKADPGRVEVAERHDRLVGDPRAARIHDRAISLRSPLWALYSRMRFGFEVGVIADSPRAARYAGMRPAEDPRGHGHLGRDRRHRWGEPDRRLHLPARRQPVRPAEPRRSATRGSSSRRSRATTRLRSVSWRF